MLQDRICKTCGATFTGGPRAYYCPACRAERARKSYRESKARARKGMTRKLGSLDKCERCGKDYEINSALQRFCPDCQPIHAQEYDRYTGLEFYHENKNQINPVRNERRRKGTRNCDWCGKEYTISPGNPLTCSLECQRLLRNKKYREIHYPRRKEKLATMNKSIPPLVTASEVAQMLGVSRQAIRQRWLRTQGPNATGDFPQPVHIDEKGGRPMWDKHEIEEYINKQKPLD